MRQRAGPGKRDAIRVERDDVNLDGRGELALRAHHVTHDGNVDKISSAMIVGGWRRCSDGPLEADVDVGRPDAARCGGATISCAPAVASHDDSGSSAIRPGRRAREIGHASIDALDEPRREKWERSAGTGLVAGLLPGPSEIEVGPADREEGGKEHICCTPRRTVRDSMRNFRRKKN
jgi:hypothetical protein